MIQTHRVRKSADIITVIFNFQLLSPAGERTQPSDRDKDKDYGHV